MKLHFGLHCGLVFLVTLIIGHQAWCFSPLEPTIECTVTKVLSTKQIFGLSPFPKLYQSIKNDPLSAKLWIAGKEFPNLHPVTELKSNIFEKISIESGNDRLGLELNGKPLSRNGIMTANGTTVANVTCH